MSSFEIACWVIALVLIVILVLVNLVGNCITTNTTRDSQDYVDLKWREVSFVVQKPFGIPKTLLRNVQGSASSGEILAVMGASGSGKYGSISLMSKIYSNQT
jgi:ABC-type transport system involved in cytochrome bd biosynthesis fused ATPase/permease subunit